MVFDGKYFIIFTVSFIIHTKCLQLILQAWNDIRVDFL